MHRPGNYCVKKGNPGTSIKDKDKDDIPTQVALRLRGLKMQHSDRTPIMS